MNQTQMSAISQAGWNMGAYEAWLIKSGTPSELAANTCSKNCDGCSFLERKGRGFCRRNRQSASSPAGAAIS